ncbi:hypothetical protein LINGRAHAP2_LOCUS11303 [Linum grandiflorum]
MDVMCETDVGSRSKVSGGEGGHGLEDDAFYEELVRQVLILTADDDEDSTPTSTYFDSRSLPAAAAAAATCWRLRNDVPNSWQMNQWRNNNGTSAGTGVFIPQARARNGYGRRVGNKHKQHEQKIVRS